MIIIKQPEGKQYCFFDLEFYVLAPWHQDYYTYGDPAQQMTGKFWVHGSGIDLTFGNTALNQWGGILIRGMIELSEYLPLNGCSYVASELLSGEIKKDKNTMINGDGLTLARKEVRTNCNVKWRQRQGLNRKKFSDKKEMFRNSVLGTVESKFGADEYYMRRYRAYL